MSLELIYTSAPKGLKPASSGFCTVAMTQGMPPQLVDRLEALSGYRQIFAPQDPHAALNPAVCSHLRISVMGRTFHVLSRVCAAGLDYSQRTNKFAHHVALDANELPAAGPAWLLAMPGFMQTAWDQMVRPLPPRARPPNGNASPAVCHRWQQVTGDAGWGGAIVDAAQKNPKALVTLIFKPGQDPLALLAESLALMPPEQRWQATFSTYYTKLPPGVECRWRCVVEDSPEAKVAAGLVINLCGRLGPPPAGEYVAAARTGQPPLIVKKPPPRLVPAEAPNDLELARLLGEPGVAPRAPPVGGIQQPPDWSVTLQPLPPVLPSDANLGDGGTLRRRFRKRESAQWPIRLALLALALLLIAGPVSVYLIWSHAKSAVQLAASEPTPRLDRTKQSDPSAKSDAVVTHAPQNNAVGPASQVPNAPPASASGNPWPPAPPATAAQTPPKEVAPAPASTATPAQGNEPTTGPPAQQQGNATGPANSTKPPPDDHKAEAAAAKRRAARSAIHGLPDALVIPADVSSLRIQPLAPLPPGLAANCTVEFFAAPLASGVSLAPTQVAGPEAGLDITLKGRLSEALVAKFKVEPAGLGFTWQQAAQNSRENSEQIRNSALRVSIKAGDGHSFSKIVSLRDAARGPALQLRKVLSRDDTEPFDCGIGAPPVDRTALQIEFTGEGEFAPAPVETHPGHFKVGGLEFEATPKLNGPMVTVHAKYVGARILWDLHDYDDPIKKMILNGGEPTKIQAGLAVKFVESFSARSAALAKSVESKISALDALKKDNRDGRERLIGDIDKLRKKKKRIDGYKDDAADLLRALRGAEAEKVGYRVYFTLPCGGEDHRVYLVTAEGSRVPAATAANDAAHPSR